MGLFGQIRSRFVRSQVENVQTPARIDEKMIGNSISEKAAKAKNPQLLAGGSWNYLEYSDPTMGAQIQSYEGWVYACVKKLATSVADSDWLLFEKRNTGSEEIEHHELIDLIEKPNDRMTKYELLALTVTLLKLSGEAYWYKMRAANGKVVGLWPWLLPQNMTIIPGADTLIKGFIYSVPGSGTQIPIAPEDLLYFSETNPMNFLRGFSTVSAGGLDIGTEKEAKIYNWKFFKNGARPGGAVETEQKLDQDTYDRLLASWESNHKGSRNAGRIAILEQGLKYTDIGLSQKDMDYLEQRKFSRDAIFALFGVPKSVLGIVEDVNRANAEVSKSIFLEETVEPLVTQIINTVNEQLVSTDFQDNLFFDYEDLTPEDEEKKLAYYKNGLDAGWISANEVRAMEGFEPVQGGDIIYIPFNKVPLGTVPTQQDAKKSVQKRKFHIKKRHTTEYDKAFKRAQRAIRKELAKEKIVTK